MRARRSPFALLALALVSSGSSLTSGAQAADGGSYLSNAQNEVSSVGREFGSVKAAVDKAKAQKITVEQRIANGEFLYRTKDYTRAAVVFSEVLEEFPPTTPAYADALWLRGETYYASKEYLSARRDYRVILDRGTEPRFAPYVRKALGRLVDVCLRLGDVRGLDEVFARLSMVPNSEVDAQLNYAKGTAYYIRQDFSMADKAFRAIPEKTEFTHQARYFLGLIAMKSASQGVVARRTTTSTAPKLAPASYKAAIDTFRQATELPPDTDAHKHVVDLSWMAIGRLSYESENYVQAAEAYGKVNRESPEFTTMLYEIAWVYVRLGDVQRAERALEVLQVTDPSSSMAGDGALLRADLLLRAGAFDKALELYQGVREQYEPMRSKVEAFLDSTKDTNVFYDKLSQQQLDLLDSSGGETLPALAVRWAREAEDGALAFTVIDDVNVCKTLIRQSYRLIEKLNTILASANRVRAFPELLAGEERALALINRISRARLEIANGLDKEEPDSLSGEIASVRETRRKLMGQMAALPTTTSEFTGRDYDGMRAWNLLSQQVTLQGVEVDHQHAIINGLRRIMKDDAQKGVTRDAAKVAQFNKDLDETERGLKDRQKDIADLKKTIEIGRAQIGLGDSRYQVDAQARVDFVTAVEREARLVSEGQAGGGASDYGRRVLPVLAASREAEDKLIRAFADLELEVRDRIGKIQEKVEAERLKINEYNDRLGVLDTEARDLVGQVARRNFEIVRDRLRNMVLRADVGVTEQAWEVREEEMERVRILQTERSREEQQLDDELKEVIDDSGDAKK